VTLERGELDFCVTCAHAEHGDFLHRNDSTRRTTFKLISCKNDDSSHYLHILDPEHWCEDFVHHKEGDPVMWRGRALHGDGM